MTRPDPILATPTKQSLVDTLVRLYNEGYQLKDLPGNLTHIERHWTPDYCPYITVKNRAILGAHSQHPSTTLVNSLNHMLSYLKNK